jgi:hypothetical protein
MDGPTESGFHFLQDYLRCQQYFRWKYVYDLEPMFLSPALIYGMNIHRALAVWYSMLPTKAPVAERVRAAIQEFKTAQYESASEYLSTDTWKEDTERGEFMLQQYGLQYPFEPWVVVSPPEQTLEMQLPSGDKFTGRIDVPIMSPQGRLYIMDHKTTRWGWVNIIRSLNVTDQACGYLWLWNKTNPDRQADGILFNIIRQYKGMGEPEFKQHLVTKSFGDIERFEKDAAFLLNEIAEKIADPDARWVRDTSACFKYNRACPYLELCGGENYQGLIGTTYRKRDSSEKIIVEEEQ